MSERKELSGFDRARRGALMQDLLRVVQGKPVDLLPFDQVRERLKLKQIVDRGVQEVPMDRIVGTLGREREFNRVFLPRMESIRNRWQELKQLAEGPQGFPPVELYYVNHVYFVVDGHHRISVARSLGAATIEARVKEFLSPVRITSEASLEEIVLKSALADFLQTAGLSQNLADDFMATEADAYEKLLEHISVHRYYRGIETSNFVPWEQAVESWLTAVYQPMIDIIRRSGVLAEFPGKTETDLYLFTMDHLHHLRERYKIRDIPLSHAVRHFRFLNRSQKLRGTIVSLIRRLLRFER